MIWLKKISRVFHVSKCRGKSLKTFYAEICLLSVFFSQVILIANCHSFKMRYWGGLCDFRKIKLMGANLVRTRAQNLYYRLMSQPIFWLLVVQMSWVKNPKKKSMLLVIFCFLIYF